MKTYPVVIKKDANGISLTSPSGNTINVSNAQINGASMGQILLYRKLERSTGVTELTTEDMKKMLDASKLDAPKSNGNMKTFSFKKFNKYYTYDIAVQNQRHEDNYVASMERKGYKHIGTEKN